MQAKVAVCVQGTGSGHLSRSAGIVEVLRKAGCEVDVALAASRYTDSQLEALQFPLPKFRYPGIAKRMDGCGKFSLRGSIWDSHPIKGAIKTYFSNLRQYDAIVSDCEPISSVVAAASGVPVVHASHHAALLYPETPTEEIKTMKSFAMRLLIQGMAGISTGVLPFHFKPFNDAIVPPLLSAQIATGRHTDRGHYLVYLPSYNSDKLIERLQSFNLVKFFLVSKDVKEATEQGNVTVVPLGKEVFIELLLSCTGVITGGGFTTSAEALHLGKKLAVIPSQGNWEQESNACAVEQLGGKRLPDILGNSQQFGEAMHEWLSSDNHQEPVDFSGAEERIRHTIFRVIEERKR